MQTMPRFPRGLGGPISLCRGLTRCQVSVKGLRRHDVPGWGGGLLSWPNRLVVQSIWWMRSKHMHMHWHAHGINRDSRG